MSFLTGVTKFSKVSIFSDLNNLDDITFDREYSSICGITNEYNESYDNMLAILRRKCDGYRFGRNEERTYNPFSLFNVFDKKELGDYWFTTGTPTLMVQLLEQNAFDIPDLERDILR